MATPSLDTLDYHTGLLLHRTNSLSDHLSDAHSRASRRSRNSNLSSTSSGRRDPNNALSPRSLEYYKGTSTYGIIIAARDAFAAVAFSTGFFFYHRRSKYLETFKTYVDDALIHPGPQTGAYFDLYYRYRHADFTIN